MYWTRVWNSWLCCTYQVYRVNQWTSAGSWGERRWKAKDRKHSCCVMCMLIYTHKKILCYILLCCTLIYTHTQILCYIPLCWPPLRRCSCEQTFNAPPGDARHVLIGRVLLLMILNQFERVTVSLQHAIILHRYYFCLSRPDFACLPFLVADANKFSRDLRECNLSCNRNSIFCTKI